MPSAAIGWNNTESVLLRGEYLSADVGVNENTMSILAKQDIPPDTLILSDPPKLVYSTFSVNCFKDFTYRCMSIRDGVYPSSWVCVCCLKAVGGIIPVWCPHCDLPVCAECGSNGKHARIDILCVYGHKVGVRGRRFLALDDIYLDTSITRFILWELYSEPFRKVIEVIFRDPINHRKFTNFNWDLFRTKFTKKHLPLALCAARKDILRIRRAIYILFRFGVEIHQKPGMGFFHPVFTMLKPSCCPNVEMVLIEQPVMIEIRTTRRIRCGEKLSMDFLQLPLLPTVYRQRLFYSRWNCTCVCARCLDPTEFGTYMGSIKCQKCSRGLLTPRLNANLNYGPFYYDASDILCFCVSPGNPNHKCTNMCPLNFVLELDRAAKIDASRILAKIYSKPRLPELVAAKLENLKRYLITCYSMHRQYYMIPLVGGTGDIEITKILKLDLDEATAAYKDLFKLNFYTTEAIHKNLQSLNAWSQTISNFSRHIDQLILLRQSQLGTTLFHNMQLKNLEPKFTKCWMDILEDISDSEMSEVIEEPTCWISEVGVDTDTEEMSIQDVSSDSFVSELSTLDDELVYEDESVNKCTDVVTFIPQQHSFVALRQQEMDNHAHAPAESGYPRESSDIVEQSYQSVSAATNSLLCDYEPSGSGRRRPNLLKEALLRQEASSKGFARTENAESDGICTVGKPEDFDGTESDAVETSGNPKARCIPVLEHSARRIQVIPPACFGRRRFRQNSLRHNGVDFPYIGTITPNMIVRKPDFPKPRQLIDCSSYVKAIQNAESAADAADADPDHTAGAAHAYQTFPFSQRPPLYSGLKYLTGSPPPLGLAATSTAKNMQPAWCQNFHNVPTASVPEMSPDQSHFQTSNVSDPSYTNYDDFVIDEYPPMPRPVESKSQSCRFL